MHRSLFQIHGSRRGPEPRLEQDLRLAAPSSSRPQADAEEPGQELSHAFGLRVGPARSHERHGTVRLREHLRRRVQVTPTGPLGPLLPSD